MKLLVAGFVVVLLLALCVPGAVAQASAQASTANSQPASERVIYIKEFPGSNPAYQQLILNPAGESVYKEASDDPDPVNFVLPQKVTTEIFDLARQLEHFRNPLESGLKIAKMGEKTFRFEGAETHSQTFNYTTEPVAQKLLDLFERIAESQRLFIRLEYTLKFDRLGVNDALIAIDSLRQRDRLIGVDHMLPLLDQIVNGKRYMNISRNRADGIARALRNANGQGAQ